MPPNLFPPHLEPDTAMLDGFYFKLEVRNPEDAASNQSYISVKIPGQDAIPVDLGAENAFTWEFPRNRKPKLETIIGQWETEFNLDNTPAALKNNEGGLDPEEIENIELILYFEGKVDWK